MMYQVDGIIVVEGKEDICYLSSFIEAEYISMNGFNIPKEEIEYIKEASKYVDVIVMTDPDEAGRKIETKIRQLIPGVQFVNIDINKCTRGKKKGIAECEKGEILEVLKPYIKEKKHEKKQVLQGNLSILDVTDKNLRKFLCDKYHLGICSNKKLFKRIKTLRIKEEDIAESIKEYQSGNQSF